jgi:ubiquinone/menaquinone biosynthesis C-methylase UbiE
MYEALRYIPRHSDHSLRGRASLVFTLLTYYVWRRELNRVRESQGRVRLRVLDIGCGPGSLIKCLELWFPEVEIIGLDQNQELLGIAKSRCQRMIALRGEACSIPVRDESADVVFALHIVEHLRNPSRFFAEAARVICPGGLLAFATPNPACLSAKIMGSKWKGYSDPTHISLHEPSFWRQAAEDARFKILRHGTTGLSGLPLLGTTPLGLIHWIPTLLCGHFPWTLGEAYICTAMRQPPAGLPSMD